MKNSREKTAARTSIITLIILNACIIIKFLIGKGEIQRLYN